MATGDAAATRLAPDAAAEDKAPAGLVSMDMEHPHSVTADAGAADAAAPEKECEGAAARREADQGSAPAAAHRDTSAEAGVEESSQAMRTVAQ